MSPQAEEIKEAKQSTTANEELAQDTDEYSQNLLVGIEAVKACDRPKPPLIWLQSTYDYISDDKENIKAWMRGSKDFIGCDVITTPECVAGIEADLVIYLGSDDDLMGCMSRCRGQFVHIPSPENNSETEDDSSDESESNSETEDDDSDNIDNPESN